MKKPKKTDTELRRERMRARLETLLGVWIPAATDAENLSDKAVLVTLKIMERQAELDRLDAGPEEKPAASRFADPLELARRVAVVSPVLTARLRGEKVTMPQLTPDACEESRHGSEEEVWSD